MLPAHRASMTALLASLLAACGASGSTSSTPPPVEPPVVAPAAPAAPPTGAYEAHEWGLIDVMEGGATEIGAGAGHPTPSMSVRKPVIYFHLDAGSPPLSLDVSARLVGGTIYETYPVSTLPSPDTAQWTATISSEHCRTAAEEAPVDGAPVDGAEARRDVVREARGRWATACGTPDGICESLDLASYDASTASCADVGGTRAGMLFYRGVSTPTLPLRVTRSADAATVSVTATASMAGAPPMLLRISTRIGADWPWGNVVLSRVDVPGEGATVTLPVGTERVDSGPGRMTIRADLLSTLGTLGLDAAEAEAFVTAWMFGLFSPGAASGRGHDGAPEVPQDAVIYFLPEAAVANIAELSMTPAPRSLRRAFMVRVILPPIPGP